MNKVDLTDVSFLIPVRVDSSERIENLLLVIEFLKSNFDTSVIVLEADKKEQVQHPMIDRKVFVEDHDVVFHRTRYMNQMTKITDTKYIAHWDADVLAPVGQIMESIGQLRLEMADMTFPYNGSFLNTPKQLKEIYKQTKDIEIFIENKDKCSMPMGTDSVGGAFIANRQKYVEAGMENLKFYGWGQEDIERVKRWEILDYGIFRAKGGLYHLFHPRGQNSWYGSKAIEYNNRKELIRICRMQNCELLSEIERWESPKIEKSLCIGLAVVATGEYLGMALSMVASARLYFFKGYFVRFFVFTDQELPDGEDLQFINVKHEPCPFPVLKKFHYLHDHKTVFDGIDYLFLCGADMFFVNPVGEEILLLDMPYLTGTSHPRFWSQDSDVKIRGTYETNELSRAYVKADEGSTYFTAGFNGGRTKEFLAMAKTIKDNIDNDLSKKHIAVCHDESHINRYYIDNPPKLLLPSYCYPESWKLPVPKKLLSLDKNHMKVRN